MALVYGCNGSMGAAIVRGMRRKLILERFRNIWDLRYHLEELRWE